MRWNRATKAVRAILGVLRDVPWLTMRDVLAIAADRGPALSLNAVASAPADLEPAHQIGHVSEARWTPGAHPALLVDSTALSGDNPAVAR